MHQPFPVERIKTQKKNKTYQNKSSLEVFLYITLYINNRLISWKVFKLIKYHLKTPLKHINYSSEILSATIIHRL